MGVAQLPSPLESQIVTLLKKRQECLRQVKQIFNVMEDCDVTKNPSENTLYRIRPCPDVHRYRDDEAGESGYNISRFCPACHRNHLKFLKIKSLKQAAGAYMSLVTRLLSQIP